MTSDAGPKKPEGDSIFRPFCTNPERAFGRLPTPPGSDAIIFLDTNVLLSPYRTSDETVRAIGETYRKLVGLDRLVVPAKVAREFAANRS